MTTIQFLILVGLAVGALTVTPVFLYICTYMVARGRWDGIRDSKMKLTIKNLLNLKKHVKEN